jgi:hypothetical protein
MSSFMHAGSAAAAAWRQKGVRQISKHMALSELSGTGEATYHRILQK